MNRKVVRTVTVLGVVSWVSGCSDYKRGGACARDGDTLTLQASWGFEVDTEAKCRRVLDDLTLVLDVSYWCEWTNAPHEDELTPTSCTSTAVQWVRTGETTCFTLEVKCTDYPPLVDDDPVHTSSPEAAEFCSEADDLPLCP